LSIAVAIERGVPLAQQLLSSSAVTRIRLAIGTSGATAIAPPPGSLGANQARALLKSLSDPIRLQVIEALGDGECCVCELTEQLDLAQAKFLFHLKVMKEAGQGSWCQAAPLWQSLAPEH